MSEVHKVTDQISANLEWKVFKWEKVKSTIARIFGKRVGAIDYADDYGNDCSVQVVGYLFMGKVYVHEIKAIDVKSST